ncbi:S41 family peptidase [Cohnella faecalis]|uniref:S41 family peptidase n=1 Tax=Cohnella faecalis TaxID=2315694 RepID=A0A398CY85_9BACL|nr:S41 family peptidase [Cohnella faecalis]RIE04757.1 S41 family peptidase [Cohnella faecalis]
MASGRKPTAAWRVWRIIFAFILTAAIAGTWFPAANASAETAEQVEEVRQLLEKYHLSNPDDNDLNQNAIQGMVESLKDPYTQYFDDDEWNEFSNQMEQKFTGIGIVMVEDNGVVYVEDTIPGSPAEKAGILPGDALVTADGKNLKGLSTTEMQAQLLGEEGTTLALGVSRDGKLLKFRVVRKDIQVPTATNKMLPDGIGYLSLTSFSSDAGSEFAKQLAILEKQGMSSLIIDLRGNGGGYVTAAQQIAGMFVEDGVLAHMKDRDNNDDPLTVKGTTKPYPVRILVNGHSASASELLSGALQDYGVAKLIGTTTYGKGVVQSIIPVSSGGVLKVTIQEYYTPTGRKVDKVGLKPDITIEGTAAEQLIGAIKDAGGKKITVSTGKGVVNVDGIRNAQTDAAISKNNGWYVNLRLGAALAGAKVSYNSKSHTISLTRNGKSYSITTTDASIVMKNGKSLIDVKKLQGWFPELTASASGGSLTLTN